jgi:hypothetical protein
MLARFLFAALALCLIGALPDAHTPRAPAPAGAAREAAPAPLVRGAALAPAAADRR